LIIVFLTAGVMGCANAQDSRAAADAKPASAAKGACATPPKDLVVKEVAPGEGDTVRLRTAVLVSYTGWLYDGCAKDLKGEKFDSSEGRATPFGLMVGAGRVIKGWDEGLVGMKEKGKRVLIIPPEKAYGAAGAAGGKIPPNATLVFDVEIAKILQQGEPAK
jgi:FKBP-type peptidyl-prolyl cis-trans isomerase